ncbi:unnamed protein product [Malus baccata var. baccata]
MNPDQVLKVRKKIGKNFGLARKASTIVLAGTWARVKEPLQVRNNGKLRNYQKSYRMHRYAYFYGVLITAMSNILFITIMSM